MPTPLAFMPGVLGTTGAAAGAGGGFLASAGGAATIDLISGLLGGIFGGMGKSAEMKQAMKMWEDITSKKIAGLKKEVRPRTPYSEWYAGRAAPMADYLQNILSTTMQARGLG